MIFDKFKIKEYLKDRPVITPMADENELREPEPIYDGNFDYRSAVGSIQWCATVARPDIARPINLMAKWNNEKPTKKRVFAVRKIIKYLFDTREFGITYSPFSEAKWEEDMKADGNSHKQSIRQTNW